MTRTAASRESGGAFCWSFRSTDWNFSSYPGGASPSTYDAIWPSFRGSPFISPSVFSIASAVFFALPRIRSRRRGARPRRRGVPQSRVAWPRRPSGRRSRRKRSQPRQSLLEPRRRRRVGGRGFSSSRRIGSSGFGRSPDPAAAVSPSVGGRARSEGDDMGALWKGAPRVTRGARVTTPCAQE